MVNRDIGLNCLARIANTASSARCELCRYCT